MNQTLLSQVIFVDKEKCLNCHACVTACPVKYCNIAKGEAVEVNPDMCIGCGKCIEACTHDARHYIDDFQKFIDDIVAGEQIVAISAPAIAAGFSDMYLNINGFLKELGVEAVFDVSFGAELTVKSYLEYIKDKNPKTVIAQPCAAIVTYIELYQPELIKHLAPVDSPMLHTAKMIRQYYPEYANYKIAVLSPCNAKRREFDHTGYCDYNIGHQSIAKFLEENELKLSNFDKIDFTSREAERAVTFSSPGGLLHTAERWMPGISENARRIEGIPNVYDYFTTLPEMIAQNKAPLLIDCLSCEFGCNVGPLSVTKGVPIDEVDFRIRKRSNEQKKRYLEKNENDTILSKNEIEETIEKYWDKDLYTRTYVNRWENVRLKYPDAEEQEGIFKLMHKYLPEDVKNCSACGYASCEGMALAIFNDLNKPENCHFYLSEETKLSNEKTEQGLKRLDQILHTALDGFIETNKDEVIKDANPAMERILKRADIVGRSVFEFIDKEQFQTVQDENQSREKGQGSSYELEFIQSDGKKVSGLVSASPIYDFSGNITGSYAMVSDISKLKKAEGDLRAINENLENKVLERTAELAEANEELRTNTEIIESYNKELKRLSIVASETDNCILIMDAEGNYEWVNDAFTSQYGLTLEELIQTDGKNIAQSVRFEEDIVQTLADVISYKQYASFQAGIVNAKGIPIYVQTTLSPIFDTNGDVINIVAVDTDISELKAAEEEIMQQREELRTQRDLLESQYSETQASINYAKTIQNAILPRVDDMTHYFENFIIFRPKDVVSGDFFWFAHLPAKGKYSEKIFVAAVDCTGHGVPGAFMSLIGNRLLSEIVNEKKITNTADILNELNDNIRESLQQEKSSNRDGMDMCICKIENIDNSQKLISFSGAKRPLFIFETESRAIKTLKGDRKSIGGSVFRKSNRDLFTVQEYVAKPNDVIYLSTDGYSDQNDMHRKRFGTKRLLEILSEIGQKEMADQKRILEESLDTYQANSSQRDDITLLGLKL